jgi:hypothetical protein
MKIQNNTFHCIRRKEKIWADQNLSGMKFKDVAIINITIIIKTLKISKCDWFLITTSSAYQQN